MSLLSSFDFQNSPIIRPPASASAGDTRTSFLVIDSRDRDVAISPSSSSYVIDFDDPFTDITSAELVYARLPLSRNNVGQANCIVSIRVDDKVCTISLPFGELTQVDVCDLINAALTRASLDVHASFSNDSQKFSLTSMTLASFVLDLSDPASAKGLLGFGSRALRIESTQLTSGGSVIVSPFKASFVSKCNYALMYIDSFNSIRSVNNAANNAFALIDKELTANSGDDRLIAKKYFNPPLNLTRLKVRFVDYYGEPYEFSEGEHYFTLKLECLKNSGKYRV